MTLNSWLQSLIHGGLLEVWLHGKTIRFGNSISRLLVANNDIDFCEPQKTVRPRRGLQRILIARDNVWERHGLLPELGKITNIDLVDASEPRNTDGREIGVRRAATG
jgi:hypothetical protein